MNKPYHFVFVVVVVFVSSVLSGDQVRHLYFIYIYKTVKLTNKNSLNALL